MQTVQGRMKYLRNAEAFCSLALPAILCYDWRRSGEPIAWEMRIAALVAISYILVQGVLYWHLKLRTIRQRQPLPQYFQPLYRFLKYSNFLAIAAAGAFIAAKTGPETSIKDLAWSWGLLGFAVLEQINYFYYQLMYDTRAAFAYLRRNGRLRKAALGQDLQRHTAG